MKNALESNRASDREHTSSARESERLGSSFSDGLTRGLGTGAIASVMAVSFREEKLALHAPSRNGSGVTHAGAGAEDNDNG